MNSSFFFTMAQQT